MDPAPNNPPDPDPYRSAQQRLREHDGYLEHLRIEAFLTSLTEVFEPNWQELSALLEGISTDPEIAFRIAQFADTSPGSDPDGIVARVNRHLHNYVASSSTLVDHARRLMEDRTGDTATEYEARKGEFLANPEVHFIKGLRNFLVHRSLPSLRHSLKMSREASTGYMSMESEVNLSTVHLLSWDNWNREMKAFIGSFGEGLPLRSTTRKHHDLVLDLNRWLIDRLYSDNRAGLAEANELIVASNAALMGVDLETARLRTEGRRNPTQP